MVTSITSKNVRPKYPDNILLKLGTDNDIVLLNRSTILAANTALANVLIGTPVAQAIAANSVMLSNITASGDIAAYVNKGGHSQMVFWADGSTGDTAIMAATGQSVDVYIAGAKEYDIAAGVFTAGGDTNGIDLKMFGDITGSFMQWDASEELLTLEQGGTDTKILNFSSVTDINTGFTDGGNITVVAVSDYATFSKKHATIGGLNIMAVAENDALTNVLLIESFGGQADTTKSTAGRSLIELYATQHNGSNVMADVAANGNVFGVMARVGAANIAVAIIDEDGDLWLNGGITVGGSSVGLASFTGVITNLTVVNGIVTAAS